MGESHVRVGRPLTQPERTAFDHVQKRTLQRAVVVSIPWLPGAFAGITLDRFILLARPQPDDGSSTLLAHELVHVEQWDDRGIVRFAWWYVSNFVGEYRQRRNWMDAYRALDAEVEARARTRDWWNRHDESA